MTTATRHRIPVRARWWRLLLAAIAAGLATLLGAGTASATTHPNLETRVGATTPAAQVAVGVHESITAGQRWAHAPPDVVSAVATGVATNTGRGAENVVNGVRLRAQLTGQEIAGGHAFQKHVVDKAEFPGITTRQQFASHIEDVVASGEMRSRSAGRTAYWRDGTIVIRNPRAADGGTAFRPTDGYDYFLNVP